MANQWFRHYSGMMRDEKLVSVAVKSKQSVERVLWVYGALLESASEIGEAGRYEFDIDEAAYFLRCESSEIASILTSLEALGRISKCVVLKWGDRQYLSDKSTERVRKFRAKIAGNADETFQDSYVTPPDTDTDTDTDTEVRKKELKKVLSKESRGTRIDENFEPDASCHVLAEQLLLSPADGQGALANFIDYWKGIAGAKGVKLDWQATFRNQLRHIAKNRNHNAKSKPDHPATIAANKLREELGLV